MAALKLVMTMAWALAAAGFAWYAASVAREVTYVTLADGRRQARALPLAFKLLLPYVGNLDRFLDRPFFARAIEKNGRDLVSAGFEGLLSGREFAALQILCPAVAGVAWSVLVCGLGAILPRSPFADAGLPLCLAGLALFVLQPRLWLRSALRRRQEAIAKALPFVLDLLTLSVEAGMDFMGALQRNCASRRMDPLNEELLRMTKEVQVGLSRRAALANMAKRVGQPDLKAVAFALVQADELGVSIGSVLRIQAEQMRDRRFDRAEKLAHEAPTKMLGPLMLCIFPAVFIILLGPILAQASKGLL
ncbi:MAG TPA: secretion system protein F [Verrucomicrobia bacterium]|nr:secretion system protein F [Verrucomicrobiota bacterium]HCG19808.1 secretion system protein F [Verrucomicrobiota bacterium]